MANKERGHGWEVIRGFTSPEVAETAGSQFLDIMCNYPQYVHESDDTDIGDHGMRINMLDSWSPADFPNHTDTILNNKDIVANSRELIELHLMTSSYVGAKLLFQAQMNVYSPGAKTGRHRDRFSGSAVALGLLGTAVLNVTDPVRRTSSEHEINPGDAIHFSNSSFKMLRPFHNISNIGESSRLSLVSYYKGKDSD